MKTTKLDQNAVMAARLVDAATTLIALSSIVPGGCVEEAASFLENNAQRNHNAPYEASALCVIAKLIRELSAEDPENVRFGLSVVSIVTGDKQ